MIKKIAIHQLTPGMFVHDLDLGWQDGATAPKELFITNERQVETLVAQGLREIYIDTDLGLDVEDAYTQAEVEEILAAQLRELGEADAGPDFSRIEPVSYQQEIGRATEIKAQARKLAENMMQDARLGRPITLEPVRETVTDMVESIFRNQDAMLSLGLIKQKDNYTFMHSVNVAVFLLSFARMMEVQGADIVSVGIGAILHDLGKMKVPHTVLNKAGRLTDDEFNIMRNHVSLGEELLGATPGIPAIAVAVASQHHERFDGSGYPRGMKDGEITRFGQMSAIVDVYDAITSDRVYHKGMSPHDALKKMFEWSAHHFNRELYQAFVRCVGIYPVGTLVRLRNGLVGVVIRTNRESLLHPVLMVVADGRKGCKVRPLELDLLPKRDKEGFQLQGAEPPEKWNIIPQEFVPLPELGI